jgi:hypothetical protein
VSAKLEKGCWPTPRSEHRVLVGWFMCLEAHGVEKTRLACL